MPTNPAIESTFQLFRVPNFSFLRKPHGYSRLSRTAMLALKLVLALLFATSAHAQISDDFSGGLDNWTLLGVQGESNPDGTPMLDAEGNRVQAPWGPGTFDNSEGALRMSTDGPVPKLDEVTSWTVQDAGVMISLLNASAADPMAYSNGIYRSQVTFDAESTAASIMHRLNLTTGDTYVFFAGAGTGLAGIQRFEDSTLVASNTVDLGVSAGQTWNLEGTAIGNEFTFTAWLAGEEKPDTPLVSVVDDTFAVGALALSSNMEAGSTWGDSITMSVTHDNFSFTPVPEPSAMPLLQMGLIALLGVRRRN